jgi:GDP-D-mannose dehydratase
MHECDLLDFSSLFLILRKTQPDVIFHLASHANVRASFLTPLAVIQNNVMGTANLFEAIRQAEFDPLVQHCSTSEVYGQVDAKDVPIHEELIFKPTSPYAVSKAAQDHLALTYFKAYGMRIIRTRMFTYLNPRRMDLFATSFAMQVARIERGEQKELIHGNLDSVRTFIDVRDAVEAYWQAALYCLPGEAYNIGGTTTKSVGDFLEVLKARSRTEILTRQDPSLFRPSDVTLQIPSIEKFSKITGWKPRFLFDESVEFLLDYCRKTT